MRVSGVSGNLQGQGKGTEQTSLCLGHLTVQRESESGHEACKVSQRILKQTAKYGLNEVEKELPGGNSSSLCKGCCMMQQSWGCCTKPALLHRHFL